jgi:uncharacterized lipoprotein YddW (UPF0748 family)
VTYPSAFMPSIALSTIPRTAPGTAYPPPVQGYPRDCDLLGTVIREAHARGLKVHAVVNTFVRRCAATTAR